MSTAENQVKVRKVFLTFSQQAERRLREEHDNSMMLALVVVWQRSLPNERAIIGGGILSLLNEGRVDDPVVVREVLGLVGTPVCECQTSQTWMAVAKFLAPENLLSVRLAAAETGIRLTRNSLPDTAVRTQILERCRSLLGMTFSEWANPSIELTSKLTA
jgi:hypothetical protein